jgi:hypothetical protein
LQVADGTVHVGGVSAALGEFSGGLVDDRDRALMMRRESIGVVR